MSTPFGVTEPLSVALAPFTTAPPVVALGAVGGGGAVPVVWNVLSAPTVVPVAFVAITR